MTGSSDCRGLHDPLTSKSPIVAPNPSSFSPPHISHKPQVSQIWNTKNLRWRMTSDVAAAACASGLVSPAITIIDRSIIERASSRISIRTSIWNSCKHLLLRPHVFLTSRPFALISALYFGTYFTANSIDTLSSTVSNKDPETTTSGLTKFLATSTVNMSLCLYKDSQFTRMFGSGTAAKIIPTASYALFALRDSITIFASFNLPPRVAPMIPLSGELRRHMSQASAAQFLIPAGMQILSTPLHLWGLDLYNRPMGNGVGWKARTKRVGRDWLGSSAARMGRIIPAFGVGGVVNARVRSKMIGIRTD